MKKSNKIVAIICTALMMLSCFFGCVTPPEEHTCQSQCPKCQLCTDQACEEEACLDKCQCVEHECESVCPDCQLCTDQACEEEACLDKCQCVEHECESVCPKCQLCTDQACEEQACLDKCQCVEHECESVCPECQLCTDQACEEEACAQKCEGHAPDKSELYSYRPVISEEMPAIYINSSTGNNNWATQYNRYDKLQDNIDYVDATITVDNCEEEYLLEDVAAEVKVRGNYTLEYSKKPIRIKFNKKNNMLGLHDGEKYKNWVLLADWKDLSMTNNTVAFYLGNTILGSDGYYCTDFRNVEVYLNNQYWGVYLLVEQQEAKDGRTSVPEVEDDYEGTDIGYFFEYDGYYTDERNMPNGAGDPTFEMNDGGGRNNLKGYTVKSDIYSDEQLEFLRNYMNNVYAIVKRANTQNQYYKFNEDRTGIVLAPEFTSAKEAVSAVLDVQSLVDTYILNEIACDLDIDWSSFYLSLDMTAEGNKLVTFEAPWDFDSCFGIVNGVCNNAQGLYAMNKGNPWFNIVKNVDWFNEMVCEKWAELKEYKVLDTALEIIKLEKETYKDYYTKNYQKWSERLSGNGEVVSQLNGYRDAATAQGLASDYLTNWLTKRIAYLDTQWTHIEVEENHPEGSVAYRFEAEDATLAGFGSNAIRSNRDYASEGAYIGDLGENRSITFTINVAKETDVYLYAGVSKRATQKDFASLFSVSVNNTAVFVPSRSIPAIGNGEEEWHTFVGVKLVLITLRAGENKITFNVDSSDATNFDYIDIYSPIALN